MGLKAEHDLIAGSLGCNKENDGAYDFSLFIVCSIFLKGVSNSGADYILHRKKNVFVRISVSVLSFAFRSPVLCVSLSCVSSHWWLHPPGFFHCVIISQSLCYLNSSFWLLVHLILFCTCPIAPTSGSSLFCLCDFYISVSVCFFFFFSVVFFFFYSCLALVFLLDFVFLPVWTTLRFCL